MKTITTHEFEPVDLALYRNGRGTVADVEAAYDNTRGLAALPLLTPARTVINIPDQPARPVIKTVRLWD